MSALDVAGETIFSIVRRKDSRTAWEGWLPLVLLGAAAWIGSVVSLGQYRPNEVARVFFAVAPASTWYWGSVACVGILVVFGVLTRRRALWGGAAVVAAYLLGFLAYRWIFVMIDVDVQIPLRSAHDLLSWIWFRTSWGASLTLCMLIAWRIAFKKNDGEIAPMLGLGRIQAAGRDTSTKRAPMPWARHFVSGYGGFVVGAFLFLQLSVGFRPFTSGAIWGAIPQLLVAAIVNAAAEEYVYRGVLMPALMRVGGIGRGLWAQGAVFGLMHWGLSVGVLAALPVSLGIGYGSVIWGKAALDTRGMAWVVIAHAMIDVAVMAAYFV